VIHSHGVVWIAITTNQYFVVQFQCNDIFVSRMLQSAISFLVCLKTRVYIGRNCPKIQVSKVLFWYFFCLLLIIHVKKIDLLPCLQGKLLRVKPGMYSTTHEQRRVWYAGLARASCTLLAHSSYGCTCILAHA